MSQTKVKQMFRACGITNKHQRARFIASRFPELARSLPPERKPWTSEDRRMAIFDATGLAWVGLTRAYSGQPSAQSLPDYEPPIEDGA